MKMQHSNKLFYLTKEAISTIMKNRMLLIIKILELQVVSKKTIKAIE